MFIYLFSPYSYLSLYYNTDISIFSPRAEIVWVVPNLHKLLPNSQCCRWSIESTILYKNNLLGTDVPLKYKRWPTVYFRNLKAPLTEPASQSPHHGKKCLSKLSVPQIMTYEWPEGRATPIAQKKYSNWIFLMKFDVTKLHKKGQTKNGIR